MHANLSRRGLIIGLASFLAAPAIVRATSIMPVKPIRLPLEEEVFWRAPLTLPPQAVRYRAELIRAFEEHMALMRAEEVAVAAITGRDAVFVATGTGAFSS